MARATWKGATLAETDAAVTVEGNLYFPPESLNSAYFVPSAHTTVCGWKGTARYYDIVVDGERNANAAWYYPDAKTDAKKIEGYVAFWHGVTVAS